MNPATMDAFLDEFEKISKVLNAITSISHISRRAGRLKQLTKLRAVREQSRHADLRKLLDSGKFDPKKHSMPEFMRYGKVKPKAARVAPKSVANAETAVLPGSVLKPRPAAPAPNPTPNPVQHTSPAPSAAPPKEMTRGMRRILGATGLGGAGAGGYGINAAVD